MKKSIFKRLSKDIQPIEYKITLKPDLEAHVFDGEEFLTIKITKATKKITLHSVDLDIVYVSLNKGKKSTLLDITYNKEQETITLVSKEIIPVGVYTIHFIWKGILSSSMRGFYKSEYVVDGRTHTMATTQFEATDARRCIPCFDEPAQKAIFNVNLVVPLSKQAISNTIPSSIIEHNSGFKTVSFSPTPKMSTYLLAFIVGDLEYIEHKTKRGVLVRVFTTPEKKEQGRFALDVAVKCIDFYEKYFEINYPLPVLDMIAIPDFESGAMENWGAVTYRETALLVDENTSMKAKQYVAIVVAHELAHQWFGNLVTMEWWTHLWLNEGFASYIEYLAVNELFPEWNIWDQFIIEDHNIALSLDALKNTHPVEVAINHPGEISEIFDKISYSKGASIIRMLANYIGYENFRKGLAYYLKKHSYKNTETIHLWEAFEKVSKKPITKLMSKYTLQGGFPVVCIEYKNNNLTFTQNRFTFDQDNKTKESWIVPITYKTDTGESSTFLLDSKKKTVTAPKFFNYINVNSNQSSFFITSYSDELLSKLFIPVLHKRLSAVDRLALLRDLHYNLLAQNIDPIQVLKFLEAYIDETEYIVWVEIASIFSTLRKIIKGTKSFEKFESYVKGLIIPTFDRLGYNKITNESNLDVLLRGMILSISSLYNLPKVCLKAEYFFKNINKVTVDPDIRSFVYNTIGRKGNIKDYNILLKMYKNTSSHEEKNRILAGLCMFSNLTLLNKTLIFIHTGNNVRLQDRFRAYAVLLSNPDTQKTMWIYLKNNWENILNTYGRTSHSLSRIVEYLDSINDEIILKDIKKFFSTRTFPGIERTLKQTIEKITININLKKKYQKDIVKYFS